MMPSKKEYFLKEIPLCDYLASRKFLEMNFEKV